MRAGSRLRCAAAVVSTGVFAAALALGGWGTSAPLPAPANAAREWPMFGGTPSRNMSQPREGGLPAEWEVEPGKRKNVKWTAKLGSVAHGAPVVAGGRVFVGTNNRQPRDPKHVDARGQPIDLGVLMCFRESDGAFLWEAVHPKLPQGRINDWPNIGLVSMPAVDGDRLYYVSNRCEVVCVRVADGTPVWRLDMIGELGVFPHNASVCSPLLVGDLLFIISGNGVDESHTNLPAPEAPSFLALDKRTGRVVWRDNSPTASLAAFDKGARREEVIKQLWKRGELVLHGQWASPTYAEVDGRPMVIFPGGDGWLRAFEPATGKLLWKFDGNPKNGAFAIGGRGSRNDFIASAVVHEGRLYIGTGQDPEHEFGVGHLWCVDLARAVAFGRTNPGHDVSPKDNDFDPLVPVNATSALAWHFGGPVPLAEQAKVRRKFRFGRTLSLCAVHGGLVYASDLGGWVYCLDAYTGRLYWSEDTLTTTWSSPFYADGKVYLGSDDGDVLVFAAGKEKRILARNETEAGRIRTVPVAVNGVLYITSENTLYALARDP